MGASLGDVRGLGATGAFVEHSLCMLLDGSPFEVREKELGGYVEAAGTDRTIPCSDLGQVGAFGPLDGFRRGVRLCMDLGHDDDAIRRMVSTNAA